MHHLTVERWSRGASWLHARDGRVKLLVLVTYLVFLGTTAAITPPVLVWYLALPLVGVAAARLPLGGVLARAFLLLPFAATFAVLSLIAGDSQRALSLMVKSSLSAFAVMTIVATTTMPKLVRAAEGLGAPRMFGLVIQFLFRYMFVLSEKAQHMRMAAACRGGMRRQAGAGAIAVLFGASYLRAEGIHRAMLARGFTGEFPSLYAPKMEAVDLVFLAAILLTLAAGRLLWGL